MTSTHSTHLEILKLRNFHLQTLHVASEALKGNPLGDPTERSHPLLVPKQPAPKSGYPVVFVLAGFTGNGPNYLNLKTFEANFAETLDRSFTAGEAPAAVYVLIDAMTFWGGSQFINSTGTGRYEDFVANETFDAICKHLPVNKDPHFWCVTGGSSGGYGALHLASRHPDKFGMCAAIAPDSFFEASLLHELWTALAHLNKLGGIAGVRSELKSGRFMKRRESHTVLNAIAMGLCYAPKANGEVEWPIDEVTGVLKADVFAKWKQHDPIIFLQERAAQVKRLHGLFLDCGNRDQFQLQYGSRQIRDVLQKNGINVEYSEFDGNHFDIGERRPNVWRWLAQVWRA